MVYVYINAKRSTSVLADSDLNMRGTWAAGTTYSPPYDTVSSNGNLWISLVASANTVPSIPTPSRHHHVARPWAQLIAYGTETAAGTSSAPTESMREQVLAQIIGASGKVTPIPTVPVGLSGTYTFWVAPASGAAPTVEVFVVNGIVTALV